jgi:hypothetical protein
MIDSCDEKKGEIKNSFNAIQVCVGGIIEDRESKSVGQGFVHIASILFALRLTWCIILVTG